MAAAVAVVLAVVIAIVVAFVQDGATDRSGNSLSVSEPSTSTTQAPTASKSLVPDPDFIDAVAYEADLSAIGARAQRSANRVLEINTQWDSREITQDAASAQLALQRDEARRIVAAVDDAARYGADAGAHEEIASAAQELADAVGAVRKGLLESGSRVERDNATGWTVGAADQLLETIDHALDLDSVRLERDEGTPVLWESLRIGDCVDVDQQGDYTEIVACSQTGRGEVLAMPILPSSMEVTPLMCAKAALPFVDFVEFDATGGTWEVRNGIKEGPNTSRICTFVPDASTDELAVSNTSHAGPFVSNQWDALARIDLAPARSVEVGECFVVPPDDESDLVSEQFRVDCDDDHDFTLSAVVAVAPTGGATALDRLSLRSWDVCADSASIALEGDPYLATDAAVYPTFPGIEDVEAPMLTLACALQSDQSGDGETAPLDDYQSGYAFSFIATQAGVYDFGRIENPESEGDFQYNEGFDAGQADVMERNSPSTEITDDEWIVAYLRGNPTGWSDGRGCTRPNPYPVPLGMSEIETDGWYAGYNAGLDSACNIGTSAPAWVGKSVCPYDPWGVNVIDQDVLCPPVRP